MDTADLREAVYDHLVANIPAVSGRVFWKFTAPADTEKPFIEMGFLTDVPSINTPLGMFYRLDLIIIGEEGNIIAIDPISDLVVSVLHEQDIVTPDGRVIRCEYRRNSKMDYWYEEFRGNAIRLEFWLPTDFWT